MAGDEMAEAALEGLLVECVLVEMVVVIPLVVEVEVAVHLLLVENDVGVVADFLCCGCWLCCWLFGCRSRPAARCIVVSVCLSVILSAERRRLAPAC